jgi:hypothetical protein
VYKPDAVPFFSRIIFKAWQSSLVGWMNTAASSTYKETFTPPDHGKTGLMMFL